LNDRKFCVQFRDGCIANEDEIAESIINPYKKGIEEAKAKILKKY